MKKGLLITVLACFVVLFLMVNAPVASSQEKVVKLKFSESTFPATHKMAVNMADWCKEVEKRTQGRVKIDFFPGGILAPTTQVYDSVKKGIADLGDTFASYTTGRFPFMETIDLPYGYKSSKQGTGLANELFKKFKPKEFDDAKIMFFYTAGPQILCSKKPVNSLEGLKGLKIRSTGSSARIVEHLGGAPVGMPMGDAYDALSRGVVNGVVAPTEVLKGWKLAEVLDSCTNYGSSHVNAAFIFMSKKKWDTIPAKDQQIIEKINTEWVDRVSKMWDESDKEGADMLGAKGGKVIQLSAAEQEKGRGLLKPIFDEYAKTLKAKGLPGDEAIKFCLDYLKTH